jgi:hypothetical protein
METIFPSKCQTFNSECGVIYREHKGLSTPLSEPQICHYQRVVILHFDIFLASSCFHSIVLN